MQGRSTALSAALLALAVGVLGAEGTAAAARCTPTHDDGMSPSYVPGAPLRDVVGSGHVLTGVVRSSRECLPLAGAKLELWPEEAGTGHPDGQRATLYTDSEGSYRFVCNPPQHIHMRVSAPGYRTIGVNSHHPDGAPEGSLDIVLEPESA